MNELEKQLENGISAINLILSALGVEPATLIGRVKTKQSMEEKKEKTSNKIMPDKVNLSDTLGIRIIFNSEEELKRVHDYLVEKENIIFIKDYVNNPRRDGLILKTDPNDVYQSYHFFTDSLNGALTEIQMRTTHMEENRLRLKQKYGDGYWKTEEFRKNKYALGDKR